jgi:predicted regulator of Ras-like GTPase activity (Roadblock/LC7/MglB family)
MESSNLVTAITKLQGVRQATLCAADGPVLASSEAGTGLSSTALSLRTALDALQSTLPALQYPISLSIETASGTLYFSETAEAMIAVTTTAEANVGEVRLEIREALYIAPQAQ